MLQRGIAGLGDQQTSISAPRYQRHQPEQTLLYQVVDKHYPEFLAQLAAEGKSLPDHVHQEFTDFLKCGLLEQGFLRVRCESCLMRSWWPFLVRDEDSAPAAVLVAWWVARHC